MCIFICVCVVKTKLEIRFPLGCKREVSHVRPEEGLGVSGNCCLQRQADACAGWGWKLAG